MVSLLPFSVGAAACVALVYLIAIARGREPRALGYGPALVPVTALWLWSLGVIAPSGLYWRVNVVTPAVLGADSQLARFLIGLFVIAVSAVYAAPGPRIPRSRRRQTARSRTAPAGCRLRGWQA